MRRPRKRADAATRVVLLAVCVAYVLVTIAVALTSAASQRADAEHGSIDEARSELAVLAAFTPWLATSDGPVEARERRSLAASWERVLAQRGSARTLRIWRADGSLLFDSGAGRRGGGLPFQPGAVRTVAWSSERDDPPGRDVYLPVLGEGGAGAVLELGRPLAPLQADENDQAHAQFWRSMAGGAILWVALFPVLLRLARLAGKAWDPRRRLLLRRVRRGVAAGELEVHYQPKVDVRSGQLDGVEALVRWRHEGQLIPPAAFLPAVEQSRLIRDLTLFVLDTSLGDVHRWEHDGLHTGVAVNLSPVTLTDPRLADDVAAALGRHRIDPGRLTLEITETAVLHDDGAAGTMLQRLASLGVRLSVDDFGTGHSSLARLTRHPFDELKIDRSFVTELTTQTRPVVANMVRMASALGLRVVAEGVEDDTTLETLRALGCDVAQGYLLGRPMPAAEVPGAAAGLPGSRVSGIAA